MNFRLVAISIFSLDQLVCQFEIASHYKPFNEKYPSTYEIAAWKAGTSSKWKDLRTVSYT